MSDITLRERYGILFFLMLAIAVAVPILFFVYRDYFTGWMPQGSNCVSVVGQ